MGRRGENIRRRKDGRWEARVVQGSPVNGRTNYKFLYGKTYQEAKSLKKAYYLALESESALQGGNGRLRGNPEPGQEADTPAPQPVLFREAAEGWLAMKKASVKESSFSYYTLMVRNHILPELGDVPLHEVTVQRLSSFLTDKRVGGRLKDGRPLKDKTVADLKAIVRQILSWASLQELIDRVPPCPAVPVRQAPTEVLSRQEQSRLEAQLLKEDTPFCLGVWLTLYGGPRIGEVCALKWEDIDFVNGTVQIRKTVSRITNVAPGTPAGTKLIVSGPKTECSLRLIPLPETILSYFQERRKPGPRYVMTGTNHFAEPRSCLARFKRLLNRAGIREYTWHALRHTFATRCVESGVDIKSLSEIMGHSDVKITMQRYVHPSMDVKKDQVNKLPCVFRQKESGEQSG